MKNLAFAILISVLASTTSACIITTDGDSSLTIVNGSDFDLVDIRVAPIDTIDYGPNLLGRALLPDEELVVVLDCDIYDVLIVDDLDAECEIRDLDLCFDDAIWVITNAELNGCL